MIHSWHAPCVRGDSPDSMLGQRESSATVSNTDGGATRLESTLDSQVFVDASVLAFVALEVQSSDFLEIHVSQIDLLVVFVHS